MDKKLFRISLKKEKIRDQRREARKDRIEEIFLKLKNTKKVYDFKD